MMKIIITFGFRVSFPLIIKITINATHFQSISFNNIKPVYWWDKKWEGQGVDVSRGFDDWLFLSQSNKQGVNKK